MEALANEQVQKMKQKPLAGEEATEEEEEETEEDA